MADRMSKEDYKKKKDLDEARKAGTLPPEQDEEGNMINPHNPEYITKIPWYLGDTGPTLKHQTREKDHLLSVAEADSLYVRGKKKKAATKYRKGACMNCGAMSHKTIECVERPRARGAWKTNKDIKEDEVLVDVRSEKFGKLAFDAKRDQWLGYDPSLHQETIDRYEKVDIERKKKKIEEINQRFSTEPDVDSSKFNGKKKGKAQKDSLVGDEAYQDEGVDSDSDSDSDYESDAESDEEEFKDKEGGRVISERVARQGGLGGAQMKTTVRNLRIREDTAKYLRNLNPNSAHYDPKSRSMRANPNPDVNPEDLPYAGDNFVRHSGDTRKLAQAQVFAWEAYEKGTDIHPLANPSQTEFMKKQFEEKKKKLDEMKKDRILDKYGKQDNFKVPAVELLYAQTENYVEYTRDGKGIKGQEGGCVLSKYIEDVYENNHTSVWGSWFDRKEMTWGYACCHSKVQRSYCTGEAGKLANEAAQVAMEERAMLQMPSDAQAASSKPISNKAQLYGEQTEVEIDPKKLEKALKQEARFQKQELEMDDRKRKYNSMTNYEVTAEEIEAYRMKKPTMEDPMANYVDKDDV